MKKSIFFLFILFQTLVQSQVVGTPYITTPAELQRLTLDQMGVNPSFAFSTRKLREGYTGFALRIRRSTDNAQADVAFDTNNVVSDNSTLTVAVAGGGLAVGNTLTLASFRSGSTLFVTIWYDQGANGYHGVQTTTARQPVFSMASAGASNQHASLLFSGNSAQSVIVSQNMQTLLGNVTPGMGLRGSVCMVAKITANTFNNFSFGYDTGNIRWSGHMNWSDGNCYIDLGTSNDVGRVFVNSTRVNFYKNYIFLRGNTNKTTRASGISILNNVIQNNNSGLSGGSFGVGLAVTTNSSVGFTGNIPEFILFPEPLSQSQYSTLENNQILFWGAF